MQCPQCQQENPATQKFCGECGAALATTAQPAAAAPQAAAVPTPPVSAFRDAAPVTYTPKHLAEKILTSKGAIEGERKGVTVMFADVSGFTAMSERLDPEDVHGIMDRAFEVILDNVHRYEGTINQFLGDGVMALFGAPIAHEDHPHRALSAALAIQEGLKPVREDVQRAHGIEFRIRMGINTGLVVVGAIGRDLRMDYTAVGDTTNLAARLLGLAQPGQIVVSRRTQHLREGFFVFEDLGEFQVKGKVEPVRAYALKGEIVGRTRLEVSKERGLTPLMGRERELLRFIEAYHRAAGGAGAIVLLIGDPGVGKSRLLYEFLRRLEGFESLELETTCASHGRSMPYRPILELLRKHLDLSEGMSEGEVRGRVAGRLQLLGLAGEEGVTLLAHLLGVSAPQEFLNRLSGAELKARTFTMLRDVFLRTSDSAPLILIVENIHWVDASSEEFLGHLAGTVPGHRVVLVLSTRPGFAAPWLTPSTVETLTLGGLDAGEIRGMTRALLGAEEVSEQLSKILAEKGEGNPLYVEEILRQLQETGGLIVQDGEARLRSADVTVPATIQDIIAARVDRISEPLKHTLQGASVIGRRFGVSLLSRVLEDPGDGVAGRLRDLHSLDFVFPSARDPELMYSFKHALTQDVVYAGVLERRRRSLHATVGLGLEEIYAERLDEVVELLAYHYGRSEEAEKAVDYAILSAEKAQRRWATTEAVAYFVAALKRLDAMPDSEANRLRRIDAVIKQAEIMFALGRHAEHVKTLEEIRDLAQSAGDPARRAAWYYWTGFFHSLTGSRPEVPIHNCREAVSIAEAAGLVEIKAFAESCLAHVYLIAGKFGDAVVVGERALEFFEARGNVWWTCRTLAALTAVANALGDWPGSLEYCRRLLEHAQAVNDLRMQVVGWWRMAMAHVLRGDIAAALRSCDEGAARATNPFDIATIKAVRGYGLIKAGQTDTGITELTEALDWFDRSQLGYWRLFYSVWLVDGYLRQGEQARARTLAEQLLAASREVSARLEGAAEMLFGQSLLREDPVAALHHLEAAKQIFEQIGARNKFARALVAEAELRRDAGNPVEARELLERALAIFEELGTLDEPPRVRAILAALEDHPPA